MPRRVKLVSPDFALRIRPQPTFEGEVKVLYTGSVIEVEDGLFGEGSPKFLKLCDGRGYIIDAEDDDFSWVPALDEPVHDVGPTDIVNISSESTSPSVTQAPVPASASAPGSDSAPSPAPVPTPAAAPTPATVPTLVPAPIPAVASTPAAVSDIASSSGSALTEPHLDTPVVNPVPAPTLGASASAPTVTPSDSVDEQPVNVKTVEPEVTFKEGGGGAGVVEQGSESLPIAPCRRKKSIAFSEDVELLPPAVVAEPEVQETLAQAHTMEEADVRTSIAAIKLESGTFISDIDFNDAAQRPEGWEEVRQARYEVLRKEEVKAGKGEEEIQEQKEALEEKVKLKLLQMASTHVLVSIFTLVIFLSPQPHPPPFSDSHFLGALAHTIILPILAKR